MNTEEIKKIKETTEEFFSKMTVSVLEIDVVPLPEKNKDNSADSGDVVEINIKMEEPQILIGQAGQTLFEIQRILKTILNKKLGKIFYLSLDINEYKKSKSDYLKSLAKDLADEVALTKKEKILSPMPPYERKIVHAELSGRTDIITESQGEGPDRHIIIKPR